MIEFCNEGLRFDLGPDEAGDNVCRYTNLTCIIEPFAVPDASTFYKRREGEKDKSVSEKDEEEASTCWRLKYWSSMAPDNNVAEFATNFCEITVGLLLDQ